MQSPPPALPVRALDLESVYVWIVVAFNVSATAAAAFATQVATTLAPGAPTRSLAVAAVLAAALLRDAPVERDAQLGELHAVLRAGVVVTLGAFLLAQLGACSGDTPPEERLVPPRLRFAFEAATLAVAYAAAVLVSISDRQVGRRVGAALALGAALAAALVHPLEVLASGVGDRPLGAAPPLAAAIARACRAAVFDAILCVCVVLDLARRDAGASELRFQEAAALVERSVVASLYALLTPMWLAPPLLLLHGLAAWQRVALGTAIDGAILDAAELPLIPKGAPAPGPRPPPRPPRPPAARPPRLRFLGEQDPIGRLKSAGVRAVSPKEAAGLY